MKMIDILWNNNEIKTIKKILFYLINFIIIFFFITLPNPSEQKSIIWLILLILSLSNFFLISEILPKNLISIVLIIINSIIMLNISFNIFILYLSLIITLDCIVNLYDSEDDLVILIIPLGIILAIIIGIVRQDFFDVLVAAIIFHAIFVGIMTFFENSVNKDEIFISLSKQFSSYIVILPVYYYTNFQKLDLFIPIKIIIIYLMLLGFITFLLRNYHYGKLTTCSKCNRKWSVNSNGYSYFLESFHNRETIGKKIRIPFYTKSNNGNIEYHHAGNYIEVEQPTNFFLSNQKYICKYCNNENTLSFEIHDNKHALKR